MQPHRVHVLHGRLQVRISCEAFDYFTGSGLWQLENAVCTPPLMGYYSAGWWRDRKGGKGTETRVPNNERRETIRVWALQIFPWKLSPHPPVPASAALEFPRFASRPAGFFRVTFLSLLFTSTAETIQSRKSRAAWRPAQKSWRNLLRHCTPPRDVASCVACVILRQISSMQS